MSEELKPCHSCGDSSFAHSEAGALFEVAGVQCINTGCVICGEWFRVDDWNTRPIEDRLTAENKELREKVEWVIDELKYFAQMHCDDITCICNNCRSWRLINQLKNEGFNGGRDE